MFVSGSSEADSINGLFKDYLIIAAVILFLVAFLVVGGIIIYHYRRRPGVPRQVFGNRYLELLWTIIPFAVVTVLFFLSLNVMKKINSPVKEGKKPDIEIIAHQWWWDMRYPASNVITANELHIPVNQKLLMKIESADVIHSWWVPALGRKIDAIPGKTNYGWIEADSIGVYDGTCSEYCGTEHAWMRITVVAESQADFEEWIKAQEQAPQLPADSLAVAGAKMFQSKTCGNCHAITGTPANAHIGPDLSHVASRRTLLSGMEQNTPENLGKWLEDPQEVKKGANMPDFLLSDNEVNALTAYLEHLK